MVALTAFERRVTTSKHSRIMIESDGMTNISGEQQTGNHLVRGTLGSSLPTARGGITTRAPGGPRVQ